MNNDDAVEWINVEPPPTFAIDDFVFKCTVAHPYTDRNFTNDVFDVLFKALSKYANEHNMSVGYSTMSLSKRKDV